MVHPVQSVVESLYAAGRCPRLHVNATCEGVVCPEHIRDQWRERLIIDLDASYPLDLTFAEDGIGADLWTVIMMVVATGITLVMIFQRGDIAYALVVIWALMGIYARPFDTETFEVVSSLNAGLVDSAALVLSIAIAAGILVYLFFFRQKLLTAGSQAA